MLYRYFGFDKFECFTCVPAKPFRLCPEDIGPVLSVHVGWANALFVTGLKLDGREDGTRLQCLKKLHLVYFLREKQSVETGVGKEAGVAELRGLGGPKQIGEGAIKAVLGIRGHWLVLCEKEALLGRGRGPLLALGPLQAAALGPTRALLLHLNGSMQELQLDDCRLSPVPVAGRVCHVSCGHDHQLALTVNGQLLSWGHGGRGQLGHGSLDSEHSPRLLEPLAGVALVGATAGGWHSAALSEAGDLYLWGWNRDGQLATDPRQTPLSTLPFLLDTLLEVRAVSLGSRHTAALAGNGSAWAWGSNIYGQLGPSADGMTQSAKPVEVAAEDAVAVDCSPWATLVLSRTSIKL
ncbi:RCC1 and BTB domain-containing protein 2-like isoform X5 [Dermacentor andersoni]|uniref:RCC1 and BTB domain-containing protein 2-like isoform X5 n=1 Tax=Dermacentor andersoni TaxID=34620 RepID=UPI003B3BE0FA